MGSFSLDFLSLKRFRSVQSSVLRFANPTFIVGQNGSGKSNVVDAFAFLSEAMTSPLASVFDRRGGIEAVRNRPAARSRPTNLGLGVQLVSAGEPNHSARYAFEVRARSGYGFEIAREQCEIRSPNGDHHWFRRGRSFLSSVDSLRPAPEANALVLPLVGGDSRFQAVADFLSKMRTYRIEPAVLREMQEPDAGTHLRSDGANTASVLRHIQRANPEDFSRICQLLASIVPTTEGVRPKKHGNKLALEFTQRWTPSKAVRFPGFNMSDGTLRALGLLTATFQRPPPTVLAIEEPEATVHSGALAVILDILHHASRVTQVVVTTHSPDILDAKWIGGQNLRLIHWNEGITRIAPVSPSVREALRGHLMGAGELLRSNCLTPESSPLEQGAPNLFAEWW